MNHLVIDVWEGSLDIDEPVIKSTRVKAILIRINNMSGGHHMDKNFLVQWNQSSGFARAPYFVYNPWVDGKANFMWLSNTLDSLNLGIKSVFVDIEVRYAETTPSEYEYNVREFLRMASSKWSMKIYTGGGYLDLLKTWPKEYDYWYARYLNDFYPKARQVWSWDMLNEKVDKVTWPLQVPQVGPIKLIQFTGDRLILPGTANRPMDVSVWWGDEKELVKWIEGTDYVELPIPEPKPQTTIKGTVNVPLLNVRSQPGISNPIIGSLKAGTEINILELSGTDSWGKIMLPSGSIGWTAIQRGKSVNVKTG